MRKLLFALPLLAGASWAGTTYYAGSQTEPAYDQLISQLNEFKPYNFESEDYQAGFLQSVAITKVMDSAGPDAEVLFRLQHVINHSPVGVDDSGARVGASTINTTLLTDTLDSDMLEVIAKFENQQPFNLFTRIAINGDISNELTLSPFSMQKDGVAVDIEGGHFSAQSTGNGSVIGDGSMGAISIVSDADFSMRVLPSTTTFDLVRHGAGIYAGNYQANIPEMNMSMSNAGVDISVNNLNILSESSIDNNEMSGSMLMKAEAIDVPVDIESASYEVEFAGLSMEAMQNYMDSIQEMQQMSEDSPDQMIGALMEAYKSLLAPGTTVGATLAMTNSGGSMEGHWAADFNGDGSASGYESIVTIRDLLMAVDLRMKLVADADALSKTPLAMAMMHPAAAEYILSDGIQHTSDVKLSSLILDVNGNPQSLEDMVGGALDMPLNFALLSTQ